MEEEENRKKSMKKLPYGFIGQIVLGSLAGVGMLTLTLAAPNIFQVLKTIEGFNQKKYRRYRSPAYLRTVVKRLERKKLIKVYKRRGEVVLSITEKGKRKLVRHQLQERKAVKSWDGKWRMIIFDINEKVRWKRDELRQDMQEFGLIRLQDSVWVYPYECEEIINLLKSQYGMGEELLYIVAAEIENDGHLKKKFHLR